MRRLRNPRKDDTSVMLMGGLGLAALAYWYFTKHQSGAAAPAAHGLPALSPHNSTLTIPTVPASSTLATPVKPFLTNPPSTLLPSGPGGYDMTTPEAPRLGPDGTLIPWHPYPVDLWEPRDGELLGPGPTRHASDPWEPVTPAQTQAGAGYEFGGIYRVQELGNGPLTCLTHSGRCGDASSVYAPVGTVVENTRDGSTYTVNS